MVGTEFILGMLFGLISGVICTWRLYMYLGKKREAEG